MFVCNLVIFGTNLNFLYYNLKFLFVPTDELCDRTGCSMIE